MNDASAMAAHVEAAGDEMFSEQAVEFASSQGATLEARAIECLAELDDAREGLRDVLFRLAQQRHPVGSLIDLERFGAIVGDTHGARRARVRAHQRPEVDLSCPARTGITLECVTIRRDGMESDNVVWVKAYLLDHMRGADPRADRRELLKLVHDLERDERRTRAA